MPLIYKPYQANIANKAGQKLYYPRLVKFLENGQHAEDGGADRREGFSDTG